MLVRSRGSGDDPSFDIRLLRGEWQILRELKGRFETVLTAPEHASRVIDRLFPPAHRDDPEEERKHRLLIGKSLFEERLEALTAFESSLDGARIHRSKVNVTLSPYELNLWVRVINDFRLLLGCELDIQDNDWSTQGPTNPEDTDSFLLLVTLSGMQADLIDALDG